MTTLTSRPEEPTKRPSRNFLYLLELQTMARYRTLIACELREWMGEGDLNSIKFSSRDDLTALHHSLGTAIRNEYELWLPEHDVTAIWTTAEKEFPLANEPPNAPTEMEFNGQKFKIESSTAHVDDHPCHPDNFSMSCVYELWENLQ